MFILAFIISCSDDLEISSPNNVQKQAYYNKLSDVNCSLNSVYSVLKDDNTLGVTSEALRSDLTVPGSKRGVTSSDFMFLQCFDETTAQVNNRWAYLYRGIFYANQVFEGYNQFITKQKSETLSHSDSIRAVRILAQAHFFRGLFHFWLSSLYNNGNIIIKTSTPKSIAEYQSKCCEKDSVIRFCINEMTMAYQGLPQKWTDKDLGRVSSGAVAAYLGQIYLYQGDYENAKKWFDVVLDNPNSGNEYPFFKKGAVPYGYSLTKNLSDNFDEEHEFNSESIFEVNYSTDFLPEEGGNSDFGLATSLSKSIAPSGQGSSIGGNQAIQPSIWFLDTLRKEPIDANDKRNYINISDAQLGKYLNLPKVIDENGNVTYVIENHMRKLPLRAVQAIAFEEDDSESIFYGYPPFCKYDGQKTHISYSGDGYSYFRKFTYANTRTKEDIVKSRSGINFRLMRLADIYLMYAECLIKGGQDDSNNQEALDYINKVRQRSGLVLRGKKEFSKGIDLSKYEYLNGGPTYDEKEYSANDIMNILMWDERPCELCIEGFSMRCLDLKRWAEVFKNRNFVKERFVKLSSQIYVNRQIYTYSQNYTYSNQYKNAAVGQILEPGETLSTDSYLPEVKELKKDGKVIAYFQKYNLTKYQTSTYSGKDPTGLSLSIGDDFEYEEKKYPSLAYIERQNETIKGNEIYEYSLFSLNFTNKPYLILQEGMEFPQDLEEGRIIQSQTFYVQKNKSNIKTVSPSGYTIYRFPVENEPFKKFTIDYEKAGQNYNTDKHFYYPIPQTELQSNPLVKQLIK